MSNELIEKIARAIILNEHGERASWEEEGVGHQEMAKECARAALAAIEASGTHQVVEIKPTTVCQFIPVPGPAFATAADPPAVLYCTTHQSYLCGPKVAIGELCRSSIVRRSKE